MASLIQLKPSSATARQRHGTRLMHLTNTTWNLSCASIEEKRDLLAYAAGKGLAYNEVSAADLAIAYNPSQPGKLYVFPEIWAGNRGEHLLSASEFRALVDALPQPRKTTYANQASVRGMTVFCEADVVGFIESGAESGTWTVRLFDAPKWVLVRGKKEAAVAELLRLASEVAAPAEAEVAPLQEKAAPALKPSLDTRLFFAAFTASQGARRLGMTQHADVLLLQARSHRQPCPSASR